MVLVIRSRFKQLSFYLERSRDVKSEADGVKVRLLLPKPLLKLRHPEKLRQRVEAAVKLLEPPRARRGQAVPLLHKPPVAAARERTYRRELWAHQLIGPPSSKVPRQPDELKPAEQSFKAPQKTRLLAQPLL